MNKPLVSVIILNWNGDEGVIECVEHVIAQSYEALEVIVIDNASTDNSKDAIRRRFTDIVLVENLQNVGFASGMNQGIELAKGEYILLLNQDALIHDDFIENAVQVMDDASPDVGMIGAKIYKLDGNQKTDSLQGGGIVLRKRFQFVGDPDLFTKHLTLSPSWCCPFLSAKMLKDVKAYSGHYFDDRYFAYGEDLDLVLRAQLRGWKCLFSPNLEAWHTVSGSVGGKVRIWEKPPVFRKHALRNRYLTIVKDLPFQLIVWLAPYLVLTEIVVWPYFLLKEPRMFWDLISAYVESIQVLQETLRLRRKVQSNNKVSAKYLQQFFHGF